MMKTCKLEHTINSIRCAQLMQLQSGSKYTSACMNYSATSNTLAYLKRNGWQKRSKKNLSTAVHLRLVSVLIETFDRQIEKQNPRCHCQAALPGCEVPASGNDQKTSLGLVVFTIMTNTPNKRAHDDLNTRVVILRRLRRVSDVSHQRFPLQESLIRIRSLHLPSPPWSGTPFLSPFNAFPFPF